MSTKSLLISIARQIHAKKEFLSPHKARIFFPGGFNYDAFGHNALIQIWSLLRMTESTRALTFHKLKEDDAAFMELEEVYKTRLNFIVATKTVVAPEMYDTGVKKGPLYLDSELYYLKGKSIGIANTLFVDEIKHPLSITYNQSVFVDPLTRKAARPPQWWSEKYLRGFENQEELRPPPLIMPANPSLVNMSEFIINMSDCDMYQHANFSTHVKFCTDAWANANLDLNDPVNTSRKIKSMTAAFKREANPKDRVHVLSWKDPENEHLFHFHVMKSQDILSEVSIEYYPPSS